MIENESPITTPESRDEEHPEIVRRMRWYESEDWLAVLVGGILLVAVLCGWKVNLPVFQWTSAADAASLVSSGNVAAMCLTSILLILLGAAILAPSIGRNCLPFLGGAAVIFLLAWTAQALAAHAGIKELGLEYVLFALGLGLLWSQLLPTPDWLMIAVRTEFFIKIGIVLLGAGMLFGDLLKAGAPGMIQAVLVIPVVWYLTFWLARLLKVDDEFGVMLSTAVSICGVSAAIAACGAIQGDKKKLSYVTSVVLLCAVPMMILMPWIVKWLGLSAEVGGAWLGGTLDTSGSVLAATEMLGETASRTGTVVKLSQNVLIGIAAFVISLWWALRDRKRGGAQVKVGIGVIWERFPKFVLGFVAASLVFSFLLDAATVAQTKNALKGLREIWFAAAFVSIGLETRLRDLAKLGGGKPALAFLGGQFVNILWTLLLAWFLFGLWK
jgi:uncharacterized integral membrane protein (TIGR00698 family)